MNDSNTTTKTKSMENVSTKVLDERWEIAERKIPSVKMLFKTNTNVHKHLSIVLLPYIEQDTIGETNENNKWHSTQEPGTPQKTVV